MIKEKFEPERGKTAGFYLLGGSFPRISAFTFDDDITAVKAANV